MATLVASTIWLLKMNAPLLFWRSTALLPTKVIEPPLRKLVPVVPLYPLKIVALAMIAVAEESNTLDSVLVNLADDLDADLIGQSFFYGNKQSFEARQHRISLRLKWNF